MFLVALAVGTVLSAGGHKYPYEWTEGFAPAGNDVCRSASNTHILNM